ncbi:type I-U CRISPR-associated protein Cas7 [bacterium]|nr:MAG: type I-U CRISPR-associated protein Cas7 [bacterium]
MLAGARDAKRLLIEADLKPAQGMRFQPTGFPSLGAAEFRGPNGIDVLLVESAQSMANRLESTAWDDPKEDLVEVFSGLPYVLTTVDGRQTDSIREAHRLNSPYLIGGLKDELSKLAGVAGRKAKGKASADDETADESSGVDLRKLAHAVFHFDPNSVLHGVFLEKIVGTARLTRVLSAFIEATGVHAAESGGVKNDRVDPVGRAKGGADKGFGNVPYARTEYTAEKIVAYFSIDLALLRSYGLGESAENLLTAMALWKIQQFLESGGRLRTACDFEVDGQPRVTRPNGFTLPSLQQLEGVIASEITNCREAGLFAQPAKTAVTFDVKAK